MPNVLIVDDSPTARQTLDAILTSDPEIRVVGFAVDGREAVAKTKLLRPDVITMDINMADMNGLDATKEIMIDVPTPIVIISASARAREVETTMLALRAGALTVLEKPLGPLHPHFDVLAKEIADTVKAMAEVAVIRHHRRGVTSPKATSQRASEQSTIRALPLDDPSLRSKVIAIVASTGGPPALAKVLGELPVDFPIPILLVQHIVPSFIEGFARWLDGVIPLHVKVALDHESLMPSTVYIAPHGHHLGVSRAKRVCLSDSPPMDGFRPAGTHLFASVAETYRENAIGIIMTGMGSDGVLGLKRIHHFGGYTIAQDESSCVVFGMPKAAIEQTVINRVLPLDDIATHLLQIAKVNAS
ncbi:chemotaxis-specific protein-glutamate methyltransferase CheB [Novipirellula artificiosorum]|uniref:Protein-glutamate methylesterase/protein-glutamine glutaminase n=1 Tax=Novipirellula artificiosorum TaxID=2528016 RepID=A0A5C6DH59_9BACT|nr:chemotaxis-specific protein-glutamate methyltransferase CheB [Novipirellula artificiosorum]TWU34289.1 Chemotaxis response regulator protein-glutamate methylesterase of group 3 operon [Novipirellula artificiosorum]